jgi:predicted phage terminase large subunit-like protein
VPEGKVFRREWMQMYNWDPNLARALRFGGSVTEVPEILRIVQSWDTAYETKATSAYSVCTTWGVGRKDFFLLDYWKQKVMFPELESAVQTLAYKWHANQVLIEKKASGPSLIQALRAETALPIQAVVPDGDKYTRACAVSPLFSAEHVWLPSAEYAPWVHDLIEDLCRYPVETSEGETSKKIEVDTIDSISQALKVMAYSIKEQSQYLNEAQQRRASRRRSVYKR